MKEKKVTLNSLINGRRYIRDFAAELAGKTGKDASVLYKDILKAKKRNHISLGEYEWTGYYDLDEERKNSVSTLWTRAEFRKNLTNRCYKGVLMNKYIFSRVFADYFGRGCLRVEDITPESLEQLSAGKGKVVIKPSTKGSGKGVRVLKTETDEEKAAALETIRAMKEGVVEEYIVQHHEMSRMFPGAVGIVRLYSVCSPTGMYLFAPVFTVAARKEISNGCQDALTAMADIRTGIVISDAVDQNKLVDYAVHPVTGVPFRGFQIPYWDEIIELMRKAVPMIKQISNIGWDIAITEDGPILIEANTIPGFNTAQYKGFAEITDGYGYQPLFDEGLHGTPFTHRERYEKVLIKLD